jgi:hypothetical protein
MRRPHLSKGRSLSLLGLGILDPELAVRLLASQHPSGTAPPPQLHPVRCNLRDNLNVPAVAGRETLPGYEIVRRELEREAVMAPPSE